MLLQIYLLSPAPGQRSVDWLHRLSSSPSEEKELKHYIHYFFFFLNVTSLTTIAQHLLHKNIKYSQTE